MLIFLGLTNIYFLMVNLMLIFGPSMEIKTPYPKKMHDFIWEAFVQCEVIQFGSTLTRIKPQQICEDGNLGSMGEYANLFVALALSHFGKTNYKSKFFSTIFIMSKKRMINSMLVSLVLLKIKGWKGMIGHPKD